VRIDVLDHGYVELVGYMGGDLNVVNAARCSFGKNKLELDDSDFKLIKYLADNRHYSPFRHTQLQFLVKAPEFVMRQWYKHVVGISFSEGREVDHAWNELSMRYTNMADADFYTPETFRSQSKSNKQSSNDDSINPVVGTVWKPDPETLTMSGPREMLADELVKDMVASAKCAYESLI
jgi:thymidylate synthase (FAD)